MIEGAILLFSSSVLQCFPAEQLLLMRGVRARKALIELLDSEHRRAGCSGRERRRGSHVAALRRQYIDNTVVRVCHGHL